MNNEEILEFLDEFEKSNTTQTTPQNTRQTTQQKKGKKRMKQFGNVEIPQTAFFEALKISD